MKDFKMIIDKCIEILSIEIPVLGQRFTLMSILFSYIALSICIYFVVKLLLD